MQVFELLVQIPAGVGRPDTLTANTVAIGATMNGKIASSIISHSKIKLGARCLGVVDSANAAHLLLP